MNTHAKYHLLALRSLHAPCLSLFAVLASCQVGPDYERPEYPVPESFRGNEEATDSTLISFGDLDWEHAFTDPVLQELVRSALVNNYDIARAAERVLEARSRVTIADADRYPDLRARVTPKLRGAAGPGGPALAGDIFVVSRWEIDVWGRFSRATEAARAEALSTEFDRYAVIQALVADLAQAYFDLLVLDAELDIASRSYSSQQRTFKLIGLRLKHGVASRVELTQSASILAQSAGVIPALEQRIEQQENLIQLLVGANPGPVPRGRSLFEQDQLVALPTGLPTQLIQRRPDVGLAEQLLIAANARIGEAASRLLPGLRLRGILGLESIDLLTTITQPIFNAGLLRSEKEATQSLQRQAELDYLQTLQLAFSDVANALVACKKTASVRQWSEHLESARREQKDLLLVQYSGEQISYLEVLVGERALLSAERDLARAIRGELFSYVFLYRALGGGWQGAEPVMEPQPEQEVDQASSGGLARSQDDESRG